MCGSTKAPGRGKYDRRASREDRVSAQRERLLHSTALAALAGSPTVSRVMSIAGVGRATFYEYFDDAEHALSQVTEHVNASFRRALDRQHQARESRVQISIEQLFATWFECAEALPLFWKCALANSSLPLSPPARILQSAALMCLRSETPLSSRVDEAELELRAFLLAASAQAFALVLANQLANPPADTPQSASIAGTLNTNAGCDIDAPKGPEFEVGSAIRALLDAASSRCFRTSLGPSGGS